MNQATTEDDLGRLRRRLERSERTRLEAEEIGERATRELYDRQRELALLVDVAHAANNATGVEAALSRAIRSVCEHIRWPVGHVYLADPAVGLRPTTVWCTDAAERFAPLRRVIQAATLTPGEGLSGRVLLSGEPVWVADVLVDDTIPFGTTGAELGVHAGFGAPILIRSEVVAVMEFFSESVQQPNHRLLELMGQIGTELGRAIERHRAHEAEQRLNRELLARAAELERSNGELEQFASIASHDLQEPLRKVRMFTQRVVADEAAGLSERGADSLQRAESAAARMQSLIEDLLAFSRVATSDREFAPVDLAAVAAGALDDLEAAIERSGATVRVGALPTIDADRLLMRQLIQNLLSNALKFTREGIAPEVVIDAVVAAGHVEITVRDNGIGFDPRYRDRIFRVFERLNARTQYEGTGIGLALCRKIVERHGGTMDADGTLGVGATFTVRLPLTQLRAGPAADDAVPALLVA